MAGASLRFDMTMDQAMKAVIAANESAEALVAGKRHLTFGELGQGMDDVASGLAALGLTKGDRVATILPSSPEYLFFFFGIGQIGAVHVPISPLLRGNEIAHILGESEARVVVMTRQAWGNDLLGVVQEMSSHLPHLERIVLWDEAPPDGMMSLAELLELGRENPVQATSQPEDLYGLIYTSGTTGAPRAVMHSHRTMLAVPILIQRENFASKSLGDMFKMLRTGIKYGSRITELMEGQATYLAPMPFQALAGYHGMMTALLSGSRLVIMERFHPVLAMRLIQEHSVNLLGITPTMGRLMLDTPDFESYDTSSLIAVVFGAALTSPDLAKEAADRFHCQVVILFGATETGGAASTTKLYESGSRMFDSIGQPVEGIEIDLVDESGQTVRHGQVGELLVRTAGNMLGYYKHPDETAEVMDERGFVRTGDLAIRDRRGYYKIVGRKKDVIIRGGQNVYPAEVESYVERHEEVQQVAIIGVPDPLGGEEIWAYVVRHEGSELTARDLLAFCAKNIAPYKLPTQIRFVQELPLTSTGKVRKPVLREMAAEEKSS